MQKKKNVQHCLPPSSRPQSVHRALFDRQSKLLPDLDFSLLSPKSSDQAHYHRVLEIATTTIPGPVVSSNHKPRLRPTSLAPTPPLPRLSDPFQVSPPPPPNIIPNPINPNHHRHAKTRRRHEIQEPQTCLLRCRRRRPDGAVDGVLCAGNLCAGGIDPVLVEVEGLAAFAGPFEGVGGRHLGLREGGFC